MDLCNSSELFVKNERKPLKYFHFYKNTTDNPINFIQTENINHNLKGCSKESVINELLDILEANGKLLDRSIARRDISEREKDKTTGIPNGIAIPRAKTAAVQDLAIAIGIKKFGIDFDSPLDDKARIIILALAPPDKSKPLYDFLLAITTALNNDTLRSKIIAAKNPDEIVDLLRQHK